MPVIKKCEVCNADFKVPPSMASKRRRCSKQCMAEANTGEGSPCWKGGERQKQCQGCGVLFEKPQRKAISVFREQKFCTKACADEHGFRYFGEDHPRWNGNPRRKHPGRHAAWARKVISRDSATCQSCGVSGVEMHAHHLKPYIEYPELRWDVDNGQTLCFRCHWDEHTASAENGVNSGNTAAGGAGGNPEPSLSGNIQEGVTTRGRAYRRWEGSCDNCGTFLSKRLSDAIGKANHYCSKSCMMRHRWVIKRDLLLRPRR